MYGPPWESRNSPPMNPDPIPITGPQIRPAAMGPKKMVMTIREIHDG